MKLDAMIAKSGMKDEPASYAKLARASPKPAISTEIATITPETAKQWLGQNAKNRKMAAGTVQKYARDMKSGKWQLTGDSIKFDADNQLLDGQHRLQACVQADTAFQTFVVYGLPSQAQDVMDIGKVRRADDVLKLKGLHNATATVSALRILLSEREELSKANAHSYSTAQILAALEKHPKITRYLMPPGSLPRGISVGQVGYINYVASEFMKASGSAEAMISVLKTGVPAYPGDPIHAYRERIIRTNDSDALTIKRESRWWTLKHAFNLFAKKEAVTNLRFGRDNCALAGLDIKNL